jgi:hypothetical protein
MVKLLGGVAVGVMLIGVAVGVTLLGVAVGLALPSVAVVGSSTHPILAPSKSRLIGILPSCFKRMPFPRKGE